ncbi:MAG: hypothetical protein HOP02_13695 [Methylococcaceae bacterium]|nr:hypothetical protein [Methylococcaceae bacterium]
MTIKSFNNLSSKARAVNYDASAPLAAIPGLQVQQGSPSLANATNEATLYSFLPNTNGENLSKIVDNNQPFLFASDNQALGIIVNAPLALDVSATSTTQLTAMPQLAVSVSAPPEKDITAPVLSAEGTLNNRINVSLTDNLQVVFSENIQLSDGVIELHNAADNSLVESFTNGVGSEGGVLTTSKGRGITLNPIADLSLDTRYYLTFSDHVIKDLAGNAFAGIADAQTLDFTTIKPDIDAPKLLPFNAQNNGNNVAKTIAVEFNEQVLLGSGTIELHQATDGSLVDTFSNGVSVNGNIIRVSGSKINIGFNQDLSPATQYYLTFSGDAVSDVAGNAFAGSVDPSAFNFTTPSPDLKAPVLYNLNPQGVPGGMVVDFPSIPSMTPILPILNDQYFGLTPVNNQTNVSLTGDFTLSFDENVQLGAGDIVLHNASDGSVVETFTNGIGSTGGYTATSKTSVIINPSADLTPATQYYLTIADTAISDTAGNAFAGFSDPGTLSFTSLGQDLQAPIFYGLYAYSDQNPKLNSTTITLNFNEAVQLGSGDVVLHKTSDNSVVESFTHGMGSADGYISTPYYNGFNIVTYAPLIAGEDYYVTLADNAITDKAGNAVASVADTTTLKFTQQQPFVYTPPGNQAFTFLGSGLDNQVGVPVNSDIQLGFSHALNLGSGAIVLHNVTDNSIVETFSNGAGSEGGTVMVNG